MEPVEQTIEERYGKWALTNLFTAIWLGDWERYEEIFRGLPAELYVQLPFQAYYRRDEAALWHDNHFFIPGEHFVSPYFSSYGGKENEEIRRKELLCLIGLYEQTGFYFPLEKERYPDHLGCITAFLSSIGLEQIEAFKSEDEEYAHRLARMEREVLGTYILPVLEPLLEAGKEKIKHPFFQEFLTFYSESMRTDWQESS